MTHSVALSEPERQVQVVPGLRYDHVMIALMDDNPFLSDGSKQVKASLERAL